MGHLLDSSSEVSSPKLLVTRALKHDRSSRVVHKGLMNSAIEGCLLLKCRRLHSSFQVPGSGTNCAKKLAGQAPRSLLHFVSPASVCPALVRVFSMAST